MPKKTTLKQKFMLFARRLDRKIDAAVHERVMRKAEKIHKHWDIWV